MNTLHQLAAWHDLRWLAFGAIVVAAAAIVTFLDRP